MPDIFDASRSHAELDDVPERASRCEAPEIVLARSSNIRLALAKRSLFNLVMSVWMG